MKVLIIQHGIFPGFVLPEGKEYAKHLFYLGIDVRLVTIGTLNNLKQSEKLPFSYHAISKSSSFDIYSELKYFINQVDIVHYLPGKCLELMPLLNRSAKFIFDFRSVSVTGSKLRDQLINYGKKLQPLFADHVIFQYEEMHSYIHPFKSVPVSIVPAGYPGDLFYHCSKYEATDVKYLLYQGAVRPQRKLEQLIKILPHIPNDYKMVIAGGGLVKDEVYRQELLKLAIELRCENKLLLLGGIDQSKLRTIIEKSYLCISYVPPLDCYKHQFPYKIFDYLACSRPVLATNNLAVTQFIAHMKNPMLLLSDGTIDDLVYKIINSKSYIDNFYSADNISYLQSTLPQYSWKHLVETKLLPIYQGILRRS